MNIQQFSKQCGLSAHTLRYYEKIGLILGVKRNLSGHRDYSEREVEWIDFVKKLKSTGMSLQDIKKFAQLIAKGNITIPQRVALLLKHREKIELKAQDLQDCLQKIKRKLEHYAAISR